MAGTFVRASEDPAFDALCAAFDKAVKEGRDNAVVRNDLALLLQMKGRNAEALGHIERAVALEPGLTAAYVNGALIAASMQGCEAALPWVDRALALAPKHVPALLIRARALAKVSRGEEAAVVSRAAIALEPENALAYDALATALRAGGRHEEALAALAQAQTRSENPNVRLRKAMLLLELGRRGEAIEEAAIVVEREPELALGWFVYAFARDFVLDDRALSRIARVLATKEPLAADDRVQLEFVAGRARLAAGDAAAGFAHLAAGSKVKRSMLSYDVAADERYARVLRKWYAPEVFARRKNRGADSYMPIFVVGMPRSGTSLIEQILASHPRVAGAGELNFISALAEKSAVLPGGASLAELGEEYLTAIAPFSNGAARVVDKMPINCFHAGFIHLILPNALIVHCRRDPLDTCLSCYTTLFDEHMEFSYDQAELGRFYRAYAGLMAHWRTVLPPERFVEVDYEAVVNDVESEARRLIAACGLDWDARCLEFYTTKRPVRTASANQVRSPIYRGGVGRWHRYTSYVPELIAALGT